MRPSAPVLSSSLAVGVTVVASGSDVTLTCTATQSAVTIKWFKDNNLITGQSSATYVLTSVDSSKEGTYTCQASNNAGDSPVSGGVTFTTQGLIHSSYY